jgi:hypothetical protein
VAPLALNEDDVETANLLAIILVRLQSSERELHTFIRESLHKQHHDDRISTFLSAYCSSQLSVSA